MPVKKETKVKLTTPSSRGRLGDRGDLPRIGKIASSSPKASPRNDKKETVHSSLSVPVYSLLGKESGTLALPKEIFGVKVNNELLAQAVRVYTTNQKSLLGSTKTRGEVEGSTAKIYRQKGTGRARHGAIRAPIFVGGGIVFGPKPRNVRLTMPQKMKKAALLSAYSSKAADKNILALTGAEKASGKTKEIADLAKKLKLTTALILVDGKMTNLVRAGRNIQGLTVLPINQINAYEVLRHEFLIISKEVMEKFK